MCLFFYKKSLLLLANKQLIKTEQPIYKYNVGIVYKILLINNNQVVYSLLSKYINENRTGI